MTNMELIRKKKVALCGKSVAVNFHRDEDAMALCLKLAINGISITPKNLLLAKMDAYLPSVPENIKPFAQAIREIYAQII